jgi:hydrogenase maturation protein HypF
MIIQTRTFFGPTQAPAAIRRRLAVRGQVQGVGFRPFAWRLATDLGLSGLVGNDLQGAFVEVQGPAPSVEAFQARLVAELPAPGHVQGLEARPLPLAPGAGFNILPSVGNGEVTAQVLPDLDVCPECLGELFDPADRRFRYPFLNCTHCGPRYSVVLSLPYDRERSSLRAFPLCIDCQAEYDDPANRRYHAQPVACPACGPRLSFFGPDGVEQPGDALGRAEALLRDGGIVAIKGLGGFHLACRADDQAAVERLRVLKSREAKPFAVMVGGLDQARALAETDAGMEAGLSAPAKPIVLAPKRAGAGLADAVAPDASHWGLMLPGTPLQHLLLADLRLPLVMTSGNPSGEPLCYENAEALRRLGPLSDGLLLHDRPIARPLDDSVLASVDAGDGGPRRLLPLRRARGFAPAPLGLDFSVAAPVLALGGDLKSAVCLIKGDQALLSEHLGDLGEPAAFRHFLEAQARLRALMQATPVRLAADLHPGYASTRWARQQGVPLALVQHHHAHIVSAMAEHGLRGPVVGIACDGTGYGPDGGIWGGEVMVCDRAAWRRAAHLATFPLLGGDAAAAEPWRPALGWLCAALPAQVGRHLGRLTRQAGAAPVELALKRMGQGAAAPPCSSAGRLFDAVAAWLGFCSRNRYEAEAAMILQHEAECALRQLGPSGLSAAGALPWAITEPAAPGLPRILETAPLLQALLAQEATDPALQALGFHLALANLLAEGARRSAQDHGLGQVVLSGGCFANGLLLKATVQRLRAMGLEVFLHRQVPCGDGGLALGQAVVAAQGLPAPTL